MPGSGELIVIFIVILIMFGPRKLPEIARMIGKTLDQLRHASQDFKDEIMKIEDHIKKDVKDVVADVVDTTDSYSGSSSYDNPYTEDSYYNSEHPEMSGNSEGSTAIAGDQVSSISEAADVDVVSAGPDEVEVGGKGVEQGEEEEKLAG